MLIIKNKQINVKISEEEKEIIEKKAKIYNFTTISEYVRFVALNSIIEVTSIKD